MQASSRRYCAVGLLHGAARRRRDHHQCQHDRRRQYACRHRTVRCRPCAAGVLQDATCDRQHATGYMRTDGLCSLQRWQQSLQPYVQHTPNTAPRHSARCSVQHAACVRRCSTSISHKPTSRSAPCVAKRAGHFATDRPGCRRPTADGIEPYTMQHAASAMRQHDAAYQQATYGMQRSPAECARMCAS